jgi:hypothetical protein
MRFYRKIILLLFCCTFLIFENMTVFSNENIRYFLSSISDIDRQTNKLANMSLYLSVSGHENLINLYRMKANLLINLEKTLAIQ